MRGSWQIYEDHYGLQGAMILLTAVMAIAGTDLLGGASPGPDQ